MTPDLSQVAAGDIVFFFGTDQLSRAIRAGEALVDEGLPRNAGSSHVGIIPPRAAPADPWQIMESTIYTPQATGRKISGPQINLIEERTAGYDAHGSIVACRFNPATFGYLDWPKAWASGSAIVGHGSYNVQRLLDFLLQKFPLIGDLPLLYHSDAHSWVCSEYVAMILRAGGWPGLLPQLVSPARLWCSAWWDGPPRLIWGTMPSLGGYNSV